MPLSGLRVLDLSRLLPGPCCSLMLADLGATADVVLESFRPGVTDRPGAGCDALHRTNRGIVPCSISGYGQDGPYRDRAGHDLNCMASAAPWASPAPPAATTR
jgi:crotonobetainyl-CoA:carnitine CoA-transferase CaiB-like acyl-CoA transferase